MPAPPSSNENHAIVFAKTGKIERLLECLESGVSPNLPGLLHCAAERGRLEIVQLLLTRGADPNEKDEDGATPLYYARMHGRTEVIRVLEPITSHRIGYAVDEILSIEDAVDACCRLWSEIRGDYARGLSPAELRVLSLSAFLDHGALNGVDDMVWQRGFWSVRCAIELLEAIHEHDLAADLREAETIIRDQAARSGYDIESDDSPSEAGRADYLEKIEPRLASIDRRLMNLFYGGETGEEDPYRRLCAETLGYVRDNRSLFANPQQESR